MPRIKTTIGPLIASASRFSSNSRMTSRRVAASAMSGAGAGAHVGAGSTTIDCLTTRWISREIAVSFG